MKKQTTELFSEIVALFVAKCDVLSEKNFHTCICALLTQHSDGSQMCEK